MGGGLLQIVAIGEQDSYLIGNPQITFFKIVHRRHTNFSIEAIQQTISGPLSKNGCKVISKISKSGDLISDMWLDVKLPKFNSVFINTKPNYFNWCNNTGHALIKEVELEIGGDIIDKHDDKFLDIWNELSDHDSKENNMINKNKTNVKLNHNNDNLINNNLQLYIPLKFFFNKYKGLSLPIIALQYHQVILKFNFRSLYHLINTDFQEDLLGGDKIINDEDEMELKLFCNYIFLDKDERLRFAQSPHEYLIEQTQYEKKRLTNKVSLSFNHPIKELIWTCQNNNVSLEKSQGNIDASINKTNIDSTENNFHSNDYFNYQVPIHVNNTKNYSIRELINNQISYEPFEKCTIEFNGSERFSSQKASHFRLINPMLAGHKIPSKHIYCYSFALKPEEHQPSGSCNFSRFNNINMIFENPSSNMELYIYAINYNILRIMSGMCGIVYDS